MNNVHNKRVWKVMCWNVRGVNSDKKWNFIRDKILEGQCDIICLQETNREQLDPPFYQKFLSSFL